MVKKKTAEEFRKEIEMLNKSTQAMAIGKVPAPFLSKQKKGTGNAMRRGVSSFNVSAEGVKDNLAPAPAAPSPSEPQDFDLKSENGRAVVDSDLHQDMGVTYSNPMTMARPVIVPQDEEAEAEWKVGHQIWENGKDEAKMKAGDLGGSDHFLEPQSVDVMPFSVEDIDRNVDDELSVRDSFKETVEDLGYKEYDADVELDSIRQGVSELVAAPTEIPQSEAVEDVMQLGEVGAQPSGEPDFDLMPEVTAPQVTAGTPFGGLPDAMPAGPMLGGDMGDEAAPGHVPNEEMIERLDGAATSLSEYMEANTQILEGLANAIQALMVRMRNVESQIGRF